MKQRSRRQVKAAQTRQHNLEVREKEALDLRNNAARLRHLTGGFSWEGTTTGRISSLKGSLLDTSRVYRRQTPDYPSHPVTDVDLSPLENRVLNLTPEMQVREARAQEEIEAKRSRIGVLYNKGAYQYISDGMDPETLGRK